MADHSHSLMNALVKSDQSIKKGRVDFASAMQKMGFTSVFDIVRLPKSAFACQLGKFSDANADLAYDNAMGYAALIARLYREHKTSSGTFQQLAQRSGVHSLGASGPTFPKLFEENWDEFCKVGAIAAIDSPVAYLSALRVFIQHLEAAGKDPAGGIDPLRILLDRRRPDLKDLLITQESTFTPRPMLEIVNDVLGSNLRTYLDTLAADKSKSNHQVLAERRYPFELPYNFYHHQCQLGLADEKPRLGELNYQASVLLPIRQAATNGYGEVLEPALQAQRLLSGLSPQQQILLIEPSLFSNFYLTRKDLINGWRSAGSTHLGPHTPMKEGFTLPLGQAGIGVADPQADTPVAPVKGTNSVPVNLSKGGAPTIPAMSLSLGTATPTDASNLWQLNAMFVPYARTITSSIKAKDALPEPTESGYTVHFELIATTTDAGGFPINLARQRVTLTLDEEYSLTAPEQAFFKKSYGVEATATSPLWHMTQLIDFMAHTGLHAEQVEMLLARRAYTVRLSPNCPSLNPQHVGVKVPGITENILPFPHSNHYGACYVNGTGTGGDLYVSKEPPSQGSIIRDQFDNAMGLEQGIPGDSEDGNAKKQWHLTKTSLNRLDRLQRMIRLQRWTGIPYAKLDTLIMCAIRAEGGANLGMELNENTLRALGVYRYLDRRYGIDPEEFAALMHDLTPYASGKDEAPLFDRVFNRVQLFDTPLILDQMPIDLSAITPTTQKTLLQLCAGLGLQPTEDSLLLIATQTIGHLGSLKRDLPTVSSLFRQARIAGLFGYSVADLLTLAGLLGGKAYKTALASGTLRPRSTPETSEVPDILDVLMQLDWAFDWLKDSQQTVAQLQQRLGPNAPLLAEELEGDPQARMIAAVALPDDLLSRLDKFKEDAGESVVTESQVNALGLPLEGSTEHNPIDWLYLLNSHELLDGEGLLIGLDESLELLDEPIDNLRTRVTELLKDQDLAPSVKIISEEKLVEFLLGAHDRQSQLLEGLFQETAKLPPERCMAVIHWAHSSAYSILLSALATGAAGLIEHFQRVSRHAQIAVQLRLSNSALRLFLVNPQWLGGTLYTGSNSEPSLSDLYLFERFSHWFHSQSQSEDSLLSYFSAANPAKAKLKSKALRQLANETANAALARLLEWPEAEITTLTATLSENRASSMADVDWIRRCQASCRVSGLSAKTLLQATSLNAQSPLDAWKAVGEAVMAASPAADSSLANG